MKIKKILCLNTLLFTLISMIFVGCGGGSSSSPKEYTVGNGIYIDSAVSGVSYICGKEKGVTDKDGRFTFEVGASCTFFIKDIKLREVAKDTLFDKVVIFEDKPKVAQFLQTLDSDGDPSNGITVAPEVIDLLDGRLPENEEELEALVEKLLKAAQEDKSVKYTGHVASEEDVKKHLEETRKELDKTPPIITLVGSTPMTVNQDETFVDPGVTVKDKYYDTDEISITTSGTVDTSTPNSYTITYTATDGASNSSTATRVVRVVDVTAPVLTLVGGVQTIELGVAYIELGATAIDNSDGDISSSVVIDKSALYTSTIGTYSVTYTVSDAAGNNASVSRGVEVVDRTKPTLTIVGEATQTIPVHGFYNEDSVNCHDNDLKSCRITIGGDTINVDEVGTYIVRYTAVDASGNHADEIIRTVHVVDNEAPSIQLNGASTMTQLLNVSYSEQGATCHDNYDSDCTIIIGGDTVDTEELGTYTITYNAVDDNGNHATEVNRVVTVGLGNSPTIYLNGKNPDVVERGHMYSEAGATATDTEDSTLSVTSDLSSVLNMSIAGDYTVTYTATDTQGNVATATRLIQVVDSQPEGFTFTDLTDVNLSTYQIASITINGITTDVNMEITNGEYSTDGGNSWENTVTTVSNGTTVLVRHISSDQYETTVSTTLTVAGISDTFSSTTRAYTDQVLPIITLLGNEVESIFIGNTYNDAGATAQDNKDGDITSNIITNNNVDTSTVGTYSVSYDVRDSSGNDATTVTRTVYVKNRSNSIVIGDLMWEDTTHTRPNIDANNVDLNGVNYAQAEAYCTALRVGDFEDWRLPHAQWDDATGYNSENNEFISIRQQPLDLEGEVWFYQYDDGDNYDQIDENSRSIIEPFTYINQGGAGYWTDDNMGGDSGHMNVIFSGGLNNMDGWSDEWNSSIRCVRTLQTDDTPIVVDAGSDQSVEVNHAITITGSTTSSATISSYEWKYGNSVLGTTASFEYTPTTINNQILILKVIDADGNIAYDTMHLNVREANPLPTVDAGENQTVQVGESITIIGTANDNSAIAGQVWKEGESELADTLSFTYTPSSSGTKTLTLTVTDDQGATASDTMEVVVTEAPDNIPDAFSFTDLTDVEPWDEQQATITVNGINTPATISLSDAGEYSLDGGTTWTTEEGTVENGSNVIVRHNASGEYETSVNTTLTIGGVSDTFTSTTREFVDQPPEVRIFGEEGQHRKTIYLGAEAPYIDASISDDVGVTYCKWEDSDGTIMTETTLDSAEQYPYRICELTLPDFTEVGEYLYTLTARDTENHTTSNELNITVLPNHTPTADIGEDRTISAGTTLNISAIVNDADNDDEMNYQWMVGIKDGNSMNGAGSTTEFSHQFNNEGVYTVTFRVADNHNASVTEEIEVTVTEAIPDTTPPLITMNGENPINVVSGESYYDEGATAVDDVDGEIYVSVEDNVDPYKAGDYNVTYRAVDNAGNEAVAVRVVHVLPNLAINMYGDKVVTLGQDDDTELHFGISSDVKSVALLGKPDFVSLVNHGNNTYHLEIAPTGSTVANYYAMTIVAYDETGDLNVTEDIHIYYDTPAPKLVIVGEKDVEVNVNETVNMAYVAENLTSLTLINSRKGESLPDYITLDEANNKIIINPTEAMSKSEFYELTLIGEESSREIIIERNLLIRVRPEGTNHTPVIHLDKTYYEIATRNGATPLSITINATDSDGDDMSYDVQYYRYGSVVSPDYVDRSGDIITISPDVNHTDELQALIHVEDDNGARATKSINISIKDQLPKIEFNREIPDTQFDSETAIASDGIIGTVMYEVEFNQCETEITLVELNATALAFKNPDTNAIEFSMTYTEQGDNSLLFDNTKQVKYLGEITDLSEINNFAVREVFPTSTTDIVAYEFVYTGQDDDGNPEYENFLWLNEAGKTAFENFAQDNSCGGGKGK